MNDSTSQEQYLTGFSGSVLSIAISLATFLIVLDYSIANVSIPYIAGDLGVSNEQGTYVITSFAVGNAIGLPLTGWLTKRVGAIRILVISLLLFTFFSWFCGASWNYPMLVLGRALQGFVAGPLLPLSQTLIVTTNPPHKRHLMLALWSTVAVVGPIAGPILGGWISYDYTWPWIFYINLPVGIGSAAVIWFFLRNRKETLTKEPLDVVGLILLALGMGCLQIMLDKGEQFDWFHSPWIRAFAITSFVSVSLLIGWSLTSKQPLLELKLFKIPSYTLSTILLMAIYGIYFGTVVLVPLWLQQNMGYTSIWAGLAVCSIGICPLLIARFVAKMVTAIGVQIPLLLCLLLYALSCFYSAYFDTDVDFQHISFSRFLLGCGIAFFVTPLFTYNIQDLPNEKIPSGAGMFHLIRAMVGAAGTSLFTTLWIRRGIYHHQILGESTTPFTPQWIAYQERLTLELGFPHEQALAIANTVLDNQAAMLSLNDCFFVMGWIFIGLVPIVLLIRKKKGELSHPAAIPD